MKHVQILFMCLLSMNQTFSQSNYQYFNSAGFKVKCECQLRVNNTFIQMAQQQEQDNVRIISAYTCSDYNGVPELGKIFNINVYDLLSNYIGMNSSNFSLFEREYLKKYAALLTSNSMEYSYVNYKGASAIEYSFSQMNLPTKAIFFIKNKKSYLLQVGTQNNLHSSFNLFKNSFSFY